MVRHTTKLILRLPKKGCTSEHVAVNLHLANVICNTINNVRPTKLCLHVKKNSQLGVTICHSQSGLESHKLYSRRTYTSYASLWRLQPNFKIKITVFMACWQKMIGRLYKPNTCLSNFLFTPPPKKNWPWGIVAIGRYMDRRPCLHGSLGGKL